VRHIILAIESSCDDTAAAVLKDQTIQSNVVSSQLEHTQFGGVVPEVASRAHQMHILPVVQEALKQAKVNLKQLTAVAVTQGPGLLGSLLVGTSFAKGLALSLNLPLVPINHMEAHIMAHYIDEPIPKKPFLCLTVSGGHTQIIRVDGPLKFELLGETIDDAAGEAFDKTGKMLGLDYPAGPTIDKLAKKGEPSHVFAKPKVDGLNFSFSGFKTSVLYYLKKELAKNSNFIHEEKNNLAASIQHTIVEILMRQILMAVEQTGIQDIAIAGGVSANSGLREALDHWAKQSGGKVYLPQIQYCTDNAAMIAIAASYRLSQGGKFQGDFEPLARMPLGHCSKT